MFRSKIRIAELEALASYLRQELDAERAKNEQSTVGPSDPDWEAIGKQLARDRVQADRAAKWEIAKLEQLIQDWVELAASGQRRLLRVLRACARYRREISELRTVNRELQDANTGLTERLDRVEGPDRALGLARPIGDDAASQIADLQKRLAARTAQLLALEDERALLQRANEAADWAAGPATRLQAAS
ncbi:hypothetical protein [Kitasatospora sp. NBC_01302]|uniref:hypothetical protein n=1 Tax=Kitasatospora sp. NBC_01302 TaxID=2903575 RepID=UPI002E132321|nr:hypothetical protein OG294_13755 [Kitasatospora sp. NBC_01302]